MSDCFRRKRGSFPLASMDRVYSLPQRYPPITASFEILSTSRQAVPLIVTIEALRRRPGDEGGGTIGSS